MLVGDAAGQAVMVSGEGIYYAIVAGKLAAETAVEAIEEGDTSEKTLEEYEKAWKSEIGPDLDLEVNPRAMMTDARREEMIRNLREDKRMQKMFLDILIGGKPISEALSA